MVEITDGKEGYLNPLDDDELTGDAEIFFIPTTVPSPNFWPNDPTYQLQTEVELFEVEDHPLSLVYLAGPISGLSYAGATDWRAYVHEEMPSWIKVLSPMRNKDYLGTEAAISDAYESTLLSNQSAITNRDRFDVRRSDMILANFLGATKVSIGTCIELGWADAFGTPVVMAIEDNSNLHDHAIVREIAGWRANNLDDAIAIVKAVLTPGI